MSVAVGWAPTPAGRAALAHALTEAGRRQTTLVVIAAAGDDPSELASELLAARPAGAPESDVPVEIQVSADNDRTLGDLLVDASYEDHVELLVIGMRRRSPVGKLLLGSTAQRVLLDADCPVTAVKPALGHSR
jgi:nucleotide-binding universal stress UspA family protein